MFVFFFSTKGLIATRREKSRVQDEYRCSTNRRPVSKVCRCGKIDELTAELERRARRSKRQSSAERERDKERKKERGTGKRFEIKERRFPFPFLVKSQAVDAVLVRKEEMLEEECNQTS